IANYIRNLVYFSVFSSSFYLCNGVVLNVNEARKGLCLCWLTLPYYFKLLGLGLNGVNPYYSKADGQRRYCSICIPCWFHHRFIFCCKSFITIISANEINFFHVRNKT